MNNTKAAHAQKQEPLAHPQYMLYTLQCVEAAPMGLLCVPTIAARDGIGDDVVQGQGGKDPPERYPQEHAGVLNLTRVERDQSPALDSKCLAHNSAERVEIVSNKFLASQTLFRFQGFPRHREVYKVEPKTEGGLPWRGNSHVHAVAHLWHCRLAWTASILPVDEHWNTPVPALYV
jgi:hypothetical protein